LPYAILPCLVYDATKIWLWLVTRRLLDIADSAIFSVTLLFLRHFIIIYCHATPMADIAMILFSLPPLRSLAADYGCLLSRHTIIFALPPLCLFFRLF